jgi:hypothetical protein
MIRFVLASLLAIAAAASMSWTAGDYRRTDSTGAGNERGGAASQRVSASTTQAPARAPLRAAHLPARTTVSLLQNAAS